MEHDRIFNHLRQRLASKGHLADTPSWGKCLQCRSAHLCEYTCHVALIINKGMCQLLTGDGGKQPAGGFRLFRASQRPRSPLHKGAGLPRQIFKGGQIGLSSVEQRGHEEKRSPSTNTPSSRMRAVVRWKDSLTLTKQKSHD